MKANLTPFASSWLSPFFNHQLFREFPLTKRLKEARISSFKNLHSQKVKNFDAITRQLESKAFCKKLKSRLTKQIFRDSLTSKVT